MVGQGRLAVYSRLIVKTHCNVDPYASFKSSSFFFFFQAEDGIRDHCVTGVQTCALPIYSPALPSPPDMNRAAANVWDMKADFVSSQVDWATPGNRVNASQEAQAYRDREIGRASCRERV